MNRKTKGTPVKEEGECQREKKVKVDPEKHTYPSLTLSDMEDDTANERNVALLKQEVAKSKPPIGNITSLMTRTFPQRRQWILDVSRPVKVITEEYPCLCKALFVSSLCRSLISYRTSFLSLYLMYRWRVSLI